MSEIKYKMAYFATLVLLLWGSLGIFSCQQSQGDNSDAGIEDAHDEPISSDGDMEFTDDIDYPETDGTAGDEQQTGDDADNGPVIWQPQPGTSWQIQYTGTLDLTLNVMVYNLDLFDTPESVIDDLHSQGRKVMCYFSAGSWEDWREDKDDFPQIALGNNLSGWPGEKWLDIRNLDVWNIMQARMDLAVVKKCDGVDPDNVDGYSNDTGFFLSYQDQLTYNQMLADQAHARYLAIGLKNDLEQVTDLVDHFDWALNESCFEWNECDMLLPFIQQDKAVFHIEYGDGTLTNTVCPQANNLNFDSLIKKMELDAWRVPCR